MSWQRLVHTGLLLATAAWLAACSTPATKPQAGPLPAVEGALAVSRAWTYRLAETGSPLHVAVNGSTVVMSSSLGVLAEIDSETGREISRLDLKQAITAGVGSDGRRHAVVTADNELLVVQGGREIWRQRLSAQTSTPPLVAGERVFVLTGERTVIAFDGASGQRLWGLSRASDPLVLRQAGVLAAFGDTLLAANGGRLGAINPLNGQVRWEAVIGSSRGTNEVERLVDLVFGLSRQGQIVCARAFQTAVGCVDAVRGQTLWTRPAQGHEGLDGDETRVFGVESDSRLRAWDRRDGQVLWSREEYRFRQLSGPRVWGPAIAYGDAQGQLHLIDRADGRTLQRLSTDGSAISTRPVVAARTLVTVNRSGLVTGWRFD